MVLDPTVFLNWRSAYHDSTENQARINLEYNLNITFDVMVMGYALSLRTLELHAYFNQVADLVFKALKACTSWDPSAYFYNLSSSLGSTSWTACPV